MSTWDLLNIQPTELKFQGRFFIFPIPLIFSV